MSSLLRLKVALFAAAGIALLVACTGQDAILANDPDAGGTTTADAGGGGSCTEVDKTPCGCGSGKGCCIGNGVVKCVERGNGTVADGCDSTTTLDCVGTTCGGSQVCCFNGDVSMGTTCAKRATAFDTRCAPADTTGGPQCMDTSNGIVHELTCLVDGDCSKFNAGTCVPTLMDTVNRVMGICVK